MSRLLLIDPKEHTFTVYEGRAIIERFLDGDDKFPLSEHDIEGMRLWRPEPTEAA